MDKQIDASIPILTEIIHPETLPVQEASTAAAASEQMDLAPSQTYSEEAWKSLEQTVRENVLRQILARVDFVLEHRIRDSLADVLQTSIENLSTEIRSGLHKTLEEVVTRAVTQEIAKAKISK